MRRNTFCASSAAQLAAAIALVCPSMVQPQTSAAAMAVVDAVALRHSAAGISQPQQGIVGAVEGWLGHGAWRVHLGYGEGVLTERGDSHAIAEGFAAIALRPHRSVEIRLGPRALAVRRDDLVHRWVAWHGALRMELPLAVPGLQAVAEVWGGPGALSPDGSASAGPPAFASGGAAGLAWRAIRIEYVLMSSRAGDREALVVERFRIRAQFAARGSPRTSRHFYPADEATP